MSELDDIEVCLQFLIAGVTSESNDAQAICAEALHYFGEDALPYLDEAIAKSKSPSVRRRVRGVIERITTIAPGKEVSVQDALLACLTVEQDEEMSEWMDAAARHLPDLADDLISLAIDLRGHAKLCRRALQAARCSGGLPSRAELRRLRRLASSSRFQSVRAKAVELLKRYGAERDEE